MPDGEPQIVIKGGKALNLSVESASLTVVDESDKPLFTAAEKKRSRNVKPA